MRWLFVPVCKVLIIRYWATALLTQLIRADRLEQIHIGDIECLFMACMTEATGADVPSRRRALKGLFALRRMRLCKWIAKRFAVIGINAYVTCYS